MNWKDVTAPTSVTMLRQFGLLSLAVFGGWGAWRVYQGQQGTLTVGLIAAGVALGALGLVRPAALRPIFTGWMIIAFPIGWTVSRIVLGAMFFFLFAPLALIFRLIGRDALLLRRASRSAGSYWSRVPEASADSYFRQS